MDDLKLPKELKGAFHLPIEQTVYVPSTKNASVKISQKEFKKRIRLVEMYLSKHYGGKTSVNAGGGYMANDNKTLINEDVVKVTSYATVGAFNKNKHNLIKKLKYWNKRFEQLEMG